MKKPVKKTKKPGKTNWGKLRKMTEAEIVAAANSDPDAPLQTDEELMQFKRVSSPDSIDVKKIRVKLHLSQDEFSKYFGVSKRTIQEWEQGRRVPTSTARNFLKVVELEPEAVQRALEKKGRAA